MFKLKIDNPDKVFFTSDTHVAHFNIAKYCNRPFTSRAEMDQALIDNWNSVVPEDGIVVHCGDFTLMHYSERRLNEIGEDAYNEEIIANYQKLLSKFNGKILLIRGNHDIIPLVTKPTGKLIAAVDKATILVDGVEIYADHYPSTAFNGDYQVFGHIHTRADGLAYGLDGEVNDKIKKNQYDVGVDQNNYRPISYWELCEIFLKRANNCKVDITK